MNHLVIKDITQDYTEYLKDESRKYGKADSISFPKSEEEIVKIVELMHKENIKITIQGSRTGITAGAVPSEGHILNLGNMNRITGMRYDSDNDRFNLFVQPGVSLSDIREAIANKDFDTSGWSDQSLDAFEKFKLSEKFFFPPDPTETSASIGGMVACNASGARSFYYGSTRNYIEGLKMILSDGSRIHVIRNTHKVKGRSFSITTDKGILINGEIPGHPMPKVKNASGYYAEEDMDLIDLFIGSEGTLGIISEIEIRLIKKPDYTWGCMFFFKEESHAIKFVNSLRNNDFLPSQDSMTIKPAAIEYFNNDALELLRLQKENGNALSDIPEIKKEFETAIYVEFDDNSEDNIMEIMVEAASRAEDCGGSEEDSWIASTPQIMEAMKSFRHAVPEAVNMIIDNRRKMDTSITKLGTDMAVPDEKLMDVISMYNSDLDAQGFESVMFGHIGNNHIHVNILPRNMDEYIRGKELYLKWAHNVVEVGGTVSAEHGIGKLKVNFLELMYGKKGIEDMLEVKKTFDPKFNLNPGNLFNM